MIFTALEDIAAYRMHTPKWAVAPTSGEGAAAHGGRANRPGVAALYLGLDTETAVSEYRQISPLLPPGTLVSYQVTATPIVDFRLGYTSSQWDPLWEGFSCDWRELWFNRRVGPPSWGARRPGDCRRRERHLVCIEVVARRDQSGALYRVAGAI